MLLRPASSSIPTGSRPTDSFFGWIAPDGSWKESVSRRGGAEVRWRRDGKELYYLGLDGQLMAADVLLTSPRPTLGEARVLFQTGIAVNPRQDHYAVSADGLRFLLRRQVVAGGRFPLTVVLNWAAGLPK